MDRYYKPDLHKIEAILIKKGWSGSKIAETGLLSQRTVDGIMRGKAILRSTLKKLAKALGVEDPSSLLPSEELPVEPPAKKKIVVIAFQYDVPASTFDETEGFDRLLTAIKEALQRSCSVNPQAFLGSVLVTLDIETSDVNRVLQYFLQHRYDMRVVVYRDFPYTTTMPAYFHILALPDDDTWFTDPQPDTLRTILTIDPRSDVFLYLGSLSPTGGASAEGWSTAAEPGDPRPPGRPEED